jgi:cell division transport system permease protein
MTALKSYLTRHAQNCIGALGMMSRAPVASALTVAVIGISLAMPAALNVMVQNGRDIAGGWESVRDFSVYATPGTPLAAVQELRQLLDDNEWVESTQLITADDAFVDFKNDPEFGALMNALTRNPLPHAIIVRPAEDADLSILQDLGQQLSQRTDVDMVKLDTEWVQRLNAFLDLARRATWIAATLLVAAVIVIIGNTIRLDIQSRRAEIEVSKLLGASDGFVRRPFLYTGFWYGLLGSLFACLLLGVSLWLLSNPLERLANLYGGAFRPLDADISTLLAVLGGGLLAGLGGAWTAVARHLNDIQPKI